MLMRSIVAGLLGAVLWGCAAVAQVPPTMKLCDGTVAGCPLIGANNPPPSGGGPATIANGADVAEGNTADAAVTTNAAGTVSAKLRGLVAILADVWDSTNHWLKVQLQAGTAGIGNVGGKTASVCVTPTVTTANAYGVNYVVGGKLTFANAFTATGSGILQSVTVTINKVETNGFTFTPFNADPSASTWTDAAVAAINATDVPRQRGAVSLTASSVLGTATVASAVGLGQATAPGTTSLYGVLTSNAALTNNFTTTGDVQVCVTIMQDL